MKKVIFTTVLFLLSAVFLPEGSYSEERESLSVKAAVKKDYGRIFFYCAQPVKFQPVINGDILEVRFDKNFKADESLQAVVPALQDYVKSASISESGDKAIFQLKEKGYSFRRFVGEKFVGLDLIKQENVANVAGQVARVKKQASIQAAADRVLENRKVPVPEVKPVQIVKNTPEIQLKKVFEPAAVEAETVEPAGEDVSEEDVLDEETLLNDDVADDQPAEVEEKTVAEDINDATDKDATEKTDDAVRTPAQLIDAEDFVNPDDEELVKKKAAVPEEVKFDVKSNIAFKFGEDAGAAVFTRGKYLWIVFDKYQKVDLDKVIASNASYFDQEGSQQLDNTFYTILRLKMRSPLYIRAEKEGFDWIVNITNIYVSPKVHPEISIKDSEFLGSKVQVASKGELKPLRLIDPEVGDEMMIVPYREDSVGISIKRKYPDFVFLQSAQGLVVELVSDRVKLDLVESGIEIAGPTNKLAGGAQSALRELQAKEREAKLRAEKLKRSEGELALLKFNTWKLGGEKNYKKDKEELEWAITEADWKNKGEQRLKLARFYFANALYPEAFSVLQVLREFDENMGNSNDVRILEMASLYFMGRYNEALEAYNGITVGKLDSREQDEVDFWKAAINLQLQDQIKMDSFIATNPIDEKKDDEIVEGNKVENIKLMRDTSSRLLKIIRKMDPEFVNSEELQQLESTARFVTSHYQEEIKRFEDTDLYKSGDIFEAEEDKLWWSTSEGRKDVKTDFVFVANIDSFLKTYPDTVYNDFSLLALEDKLKRNDLAAAEEIIDGFREEKRTQAKNSIDFFRGLFFAKDDEDDKAVEIWNKVIADPLDRFNRARAQFAMTVFLLKKDKIDVKTAAEKLDALRAVWRGGVLEFHILKMLGELNMEQKKYMEGFEVWRDAINAFPGSDEALLIAKKMSDSFVQIFSQGGADDLKKLDALTLYYEFRELTPIGKLGDEMISRLVDRLVEVDLLDRAAALLTHQVRFRLIGAERDAASTKLVKIHLMNQHPQDALDVINATQHSDMGEAIALERKYLKATVLTKLGKSNKVLALLKGDDSHKASFLRANVYWQNRVWRKVVDELETPFREIRREAKPLDQEATEQILRLAVAYALTNRKKRLSVLYEDFGDLIKDDDRKKIFTFVATDRGPVDYRDLQNTVEFGDMKDFLIKYLESNDGDTNTSATDQAVNVNG